MPDDTTVATVIDKGIDKGMSILTVRIPDNVKRDLVNYSRSIGMSTDSVVSLALENYLRKGR
jgi:hypothetical protein